MTREEAISWLKELTWHKGEDVEINDTDVETIKMAIEALKQEPCEDVVSRKTIDQNIYDYAESNGISYANLKNAILDAPSVTITQRWIPVNERLPKKSDNYWCTFGGTNLIGTDYYTTELDAKETFDDVAEEYVGWRSHNVIAWMPLPQSYKAEKDMRESRLKE